MHASGIEVIKVHFVSFLCALQQPFTTLFQRHSFLQHILFNIYTTFAFQKDM